MEKLVRSFKTAVAHYPSTSVATHTATRRRAHKGRHGTTHLLCLTKNDDAPPLRHEDHEETIVSNEGTIVTDDVGRNGVPHLDGTTRRRTSVASRQTTQTATTKGRTSIASQRRTHLCCVTTNDAPPLRHEPTHLHCVTNTSVATHTATTNRRTSIASRRIDAPPLRHAKTNRTDAPLLRHDKRRTSIASRNDAPPLRHKTKRTNVQTKRRLHLHCNATNTNPRIVTNATNNDEDR